MMSPCMDCLCDRVDPLFHLVLQTLLEVDRRHQYGSKPKAFGNMDVILPRMDVILP